MCGLSPTIDSILFAKIFLPAEGTMVRNKLTCEVPKVRSYGIYPSLHDRAGWGVLLQNSQNTFNLPFLHLGTRLDMYSGILVLIN